jgi:hypothetical protein
LRSRLSRKETPMNIKPFKSVVTHVADGQWHLSEDDVRIDSQRTSSNLEMAR